MHQMVIWRNNRHGCLELCVWMFYSNLITNVVSRRRSLSEWNNAQSVDFPLQQIIIVCYIMGFWCIMKTRVCFRCEQKGVKTWMTNLERNECGDSQEDHRPSAWHYYCEIRGNWGTEITRTQAVRDYMPVECLIQWVIEIHSICI